MDHMSISVFELSFVIFSQVMYSKRLQRDAQIMPKQIKGKRYGEINPENYNFDRI